MSAKPINVIVAEALEFYMRGRFNKLGLSKASGVADGTIRNFLAPENRATGKSGKEASGKLTELQMLADALHVPMAELVTDLTEDERLDRWKRRVADHYVQFGVMPAWAPPASIGKPQAQAA
jgi:hypothetical protein